MTTPLPQTPGDQREDQSAITGAAIGDLYANAELAIIAAIAALARKLAARAIGQAAAGRQVRRTVTSVLSGIAPRVRALLDSGMNQAATQSAAAVRVPVAGPHAPIRVLNPARPVQDLGTWTQPVAKLLDTAGDTAAQAAEDEFTAVAKAIANATTKTAGQLAALVVPPVNPYQAAISQAFGDSGGWPGSTLSYRRYQAAQAALDDLAAQGITGFTDRAGRNWDLATYVEMLTRTAVSNAWDDMQAAAAARSGLDLVETSTYSTEGSCPLCVPWLGKTLSLTGATSGYRTVADAKAAGWRHPNCRCFWTVIGGGYMTDVTNPVDITRAAYAYRAGQRQRVLERSVRQAARHVQAATTPQAKTRARRGWRNAREASAAHRRGSGLVQTRADAERRETPWYPPAADGGNDAAPPAPPGSPPAPPEPPADPPGGTPPGPPEPPPAGGGEDWPPLGELIPSDDDDWEARQGEITSVLARYLNGAYAGFRVRINREEIYYENGELSAQFVIMGPDGRYAGLTARLFGRKPDGRLYAEHELLELGKDVRGQGFAAAWNARLEAWYRRSGVGWIQMLANIDVGGYAWASAGYGFADEDEAAKVLALLAGQVADTARTAANSTLPASARAAATAESAAAKVILRAAETHRFGMPGYPTAWMISQCGRLPGQGRDDLWIGKRAMLGSSWYAVKQV